jgi:phosphohistidine phosphatase
MDRLYLLRHGTAVPHGTPDIPDDERPLTREGEKVVRRVARGLRRLDLDLDRIVTSPLPRALRTAEIVADVLEMADLLEIADPLRAGNHATTIRDWVTARTESRLLLVGHNPSLTDLIGLLITGEPGPPLCELRTGGVAALSTDGDGGMRLDWLARPRLFRRLRD